MRFFVALLLRMTLAGIRWVVGQVEQQNKEPQNHEGITSIFCGSKSIVLLDSARGLNPPYIGSYGVMECWSIGDFGLLGGIEHRA
jgi:hypothetical protein